MSIIKVICSSLVNNPHCAHGPTLEFIRLTNNKEHRFFACSAYRDRKDCCFYHPADEEITDRKKLSWDLEKKRLLPPIDHKKLLTRLKSIIKLPVKERGYCHTCNKLCFVSEQNSHKDHDFQMGISDYMLKHPSQVIKPQKGSKKEAQFFFSKSTTELIMDNLKKNSITKVLCIGTPRIYERIQEEEKTTINSLLLDFDHRYHQFYTEEQYCWFNMCNHHFLGDNANVSQKVFKDFLTDGNIAIVSDPPFGSRVEPLANTFKYMCELHGAMTSSSSDILVFWIFPYFMEPQILNAYPTMAMLDYKVTYENHNEYKIGAKGCKNGSPIRIFTNMDVSKFQLPSEEGYKFCRLCNRWVSLENKHCFQCNCCPSKSGQTYVHCEMCGKCVKPSWTHCMVCERCSLPNHRCNEQQVDDDCNGTSSLTPNKRTRKLQRNVEFKKKKRKKR